MARPIHDLLRPCFNRRQVRGSTLLNQIMVSDLTISWKDYEQMKNGELKPIFVSPVINEAVRQINEDLGKEELPVGESQHDHDDSA